MAATLSPPGGDPETMGQRQWDDRPAATTTLAPEEVARRAAFLVKARAEQADADRRARDGSMGALGRFVHWLTPRL